MFASTLGGILGALAALVLLIRIPAPKVGFFYVFAPVFLTCYFGGSFVAAGSVMSLETGRKEDDEEDEEMDA
jgi:fructose-specific phosphotransferase system IIC component